MKYVIIGGVAAGMSAAMEIYRTDNAAEITVLERGSDYSYGQCGLPYTVNGVVPSFDDVVEQTPEQFREKFGIDARTEMVVTEVNTDEGEVVAVDQQSDESITFTYDRLLIATGSDPIKPDWDGIDLDGIYPLKTIDDTKKLVSALTDNVKHVTVIGAGYIGLEMAEVLRTRDLDVRMIQRENQLANIFDPDMAKHIEDEARKQKIEVILEETVESFSGNGRVEEVITDKGSYQTDLVLLAIGVKPNTEFLESTGIHLLDNGAILVNDYMQTSIENVYAAGDCASQYHRVKQINDFIPLGTTANKQGRIAGMNMAGGAHTFNGIVGTTIVKFFDFALGRTGLSEKEADQLGIPFDVVSSEGISHAGYYPETEKLYLKLIYHTETKQLLGGQVIGKKGVSKRVDVLATALYAKLTITQILDLDLSYAPPYNGVWDPLQQLVRKSGLG
ncbi:CoA-disulfide reductase [Amphibacillus indicireducens]|uniref:FAD-dependent oxidoreductase n=1 Tax=Amphibacillus indicireducens TaxID=1076330 RepID=A0ABP7V6V9_9BACI